MFDRVADVAVDRVAAVVGRVVGIESGQKILYRVMLALSMTQ